MLYIRYLIIVYGQSINKNSKIFKFSAIEGGTLSMQFVRTSGAAKAPTNSNIGGFRGPMALATQV